MFNKEYYLKNRKKILAVNKKWHLKNKEKIALYVKEWAIKNKEKRLITLKAWKLKNKNKIKKKRRLHYLKNKKHTLLINKQWAIKNNEKKLLLWRNYYYRNTKKLNKNRVKRSIKQYKTDESYRLIQLVRGRINQVLKNKNLKKVDKSINLLGMNGYNFKKYIENKFKPGMSWEKRSLIHIDHIIPCASFDLKDPKQQAKCFHYTNLQPLWAKENLSKGAKIL
jgi:hypothetical protein